jgi:catechol 2,3-dioxygenase-like lactoylglutathione lyase family enzyme
MIQAQAVFSGFSVNDLSKAKDFYTQALGLKLADENMGLRLQLPNGGELFVYEKANHQPATFTILNFVVADIDAAVDELTRLGCSFERYNEMPAPQDEKGIMRSSEANPGPNIAWLKDPAGNIISILQE